MIISHRHRFIFLRVPKTASTSVQIAFGKFCGDEDILTPLSTRTEPMLTDADLPASRNLKVARHRYTARDWYNFLLRGQPAEFYQHITAKRIRQYLGENDWEAYFKFCVVRNPFDRAVSLYRWQARKATTADDLNRYILNLPEDKLATWHRYTLRNRIVMDQVCRYEALEQDLLSAAETIGIPLLALPHAKSGGQGNRQHYRELIHPRARQRIELVCRKELDAFGYTWDEG